MSAFETAFLDLIDTFHALHKAQEKKQNIYFVVRNDLPNQRETYIYINIAENYRQKSAHETMLVEKVKHGIVEKINALIDASGDVAILNPKLFELNITIDKNGSVKITFLNVPSSKKTLKNAKAHVSFLCRALITLPSHEGRIFSRADRVIGAPDIAHAILINGLIEYGKNFKKTKLFDFRETFDTKDIQRDFENLSNSVAF